MQKRCQAFLNLLMLSLTVQPAIAQEWDEAMADKAYAFCERNGYFMTEAYIESKDYTVGVCSDSFPGFSHEVHGCYEAVKYFIVVQSATDNKILRLPTWPKSKGNYPKAVYTFESILNGIKYQVKTTGGTVGYEPSMKFWTTVLLEKSGKAIYNNRVNYYYGDIGMGC